MKLNTSNSVLTTLNQPRKFLHYNAASFLITEALKTGFLFGKIRLPQQSFVSLVIWKENHPVTLSYMGSDRLPIKYSVLELYLRSLLPTKSQVRNQESEQALRSYLVKSYLSLGVSKAIQKNRLMELHLHPCCPAREP